MSGIHISFYLRANRIHIFAETLRSLGNPGRICFLLSQDSQTLLMRAHNRRDFVSHNVPRDVYDGKRSFEISTHGLCKILRELHGWDAENSYRVPGRMDAGMGAAVFYLGKAEVIQSSEGGGGK